MRRTTVAQRWRELKTTTTSCHGTWRHAALLADSHTFFTSSPSLHSHIALHRHPAQVSSQEHWTLKLFPIIGNTKLSLSLSSRLNFWIIWLYPWTNNYTIMKNFTALFLLASAHLSRSLIETYLFLPFSFINILRFSLWDRPGRDADSACFTSPHHQIMIIFPTATLANCFKAAAGKLGIFLNLHWKYLQLWVDNFVYSIP